MKSGVARFRELYLSLKRLGRKKIKKEAKKEGNWDRGKAHQVQTRGRKMKK